MTTVTDRFQIKLATVIDSVTTEHASPTQADVKVRLSQRIMNCLVKLRLYLPSLLLGSAGEFNAVPVTNALLDIEARDRARIDAEVRRVCKLLLNDNINAIANEEIIQIESDSNDTSYFYQKIAAVLNWKFVIKTLPPVVTKQRQIIDGKVVKAGDAVYASGNEQPAHTSIAQ